MLKEILKGKDIQNKYQLNGIVKASKNDIFNIIKKDNEIIIKKENYNNHCKICNEFTNYFIYNTPINTFSKDKNIYKKYLESK